jgi:hypothetical protein
LRRLFRTNVRGKPLLFIEIHGLRP